ncbi:MAG: hypothetical protein R8F63_18365 [Acidimicrobiales bacterium]|nr:hypothetical protein [Acidimicrobiales bacterium]
MPFHDDDPIWYASYGSNCSAERFTMYLTGGRAAGATRDERGARNPAPPRSIEPIWFDSDVRFLGNAAKWGGGGVAYLSHEPGGRAPGTRYLITKGQFDDVAAQESRRDTVATPLHECEIGVVHPIGNGFYDGLLVLEPIDGTPVVTFTSPEPHVPLQPNPPSAAYLGTILRGLVAVHDGDRDTIVDHLRHDRALAAGWTREAMLALL